MADYIYTAFQPSATINGIAVMSKGSALASMIWVAIIVYTTDRRWIKAAIFCVVAAFFAGCGIIHQNSAFSNWKTGFLETDPPGSTAPSKFMAGYLSMAAVAGIMWLLQKFMGKKLSPDDPGYADDHGYLPPLKEKGVDNLFKTWWSPALGTEATKDPDETKKSGEEYFEEEEEELEGINTKKKKGKRLAGAESMGVGVPVLTPARAFKDPVVPEEEAPQEEPPADDNA